MFGWKYGDFKWESRFSVYAPTGAFETGNLANVGKNYWTFEPVLAASFFSTKISLELTHWSRLVLAGASTFRRSGDSLS